MIPRAAMIGLRRSDATTAPSACATAFPIRGVTAVAMGDGIARDRRAGCWETGSTGGRTGAQTARSAPSPAQREDGCARLAMTVRYLCPSPSLPDLPAVVSPSHAGTGET